MLSRSMRQILWVEEAVPGASAQSCLIIPQIVAHTAGGEGVYVRNTMFPCNPAVHFKSNSWEDEG